MAANRIKGITVEIGGDTTGLSKARYKACPDEEARQKLISLIKSAVDILYQKVNGKYPIQNDIELSF